ncbi:signal recognition particle-docking protein FtsY [Mesorhizobium koreense]|uniref:signal recognition particle-docking protein FtsY n=1 Tax=Mesorhizobium koreense TaxID=3074855 RepID=UPI00287B6AE1|nr:signal recognition particle-docking protein FtsY [Mesorhizobium sp. WR6]
MAFGFIKKVFSFGKKQVEERPAEDETLPPLNLDALEGFKGKAPEKPEPPVARDTVAEPEPAPQPVPPPEQPAPERAPEAYPIAESQPVPTPETPSEPEPGPAPEVLSEPVAEELEPARQETPGEPKPRPEAAPVPEVPAEPEQEPLPPPVVSAEPIREEPKPTPEPLTTPEVPSALESAPEAPSEPGPKKPEPAPQAAPPEPEPAPEVPPEPTPETPQPEPDDVPAVPEPPLETPGAAETPPSAAPASPRKPEGKVSVAKAVERKLEPEKTPEPAPAPRQSWFQRMRAGLSRSSRELTGNIAGIFTKRKLDEDTLQDLEDVLIRADLGVETAIRVTDALASGRYGRDISDAEVRGVMATEMEKVLAPVALPLELDLSHKPHVILVVGVNGTGKTTTIGKLAAKLTAGGLSVMLAAGDTFRAAAIEQLKIWGERTHSPVIASKLGADAAGLAYDAFEKAKEAGSDVLIIDTAGRLQNRAELMAELEKIVRVLGKLDPEAPHTVLQTVDATTGQNALNQVEIFRNIAGVNGLVLTKLDGTARGGILVAIAAKHKLPVYFIGVGEQVDDLEPFSAKEFAQAIAGVA